MITTGCEGCCFLKQDIKGKGCSIHQLCAIKDEKIFAPGYCRMCRSNKWAAKQGTTELAKLHQKVLDERKLKFDMLVFFDEATNNLSDLKRTLDSDWYSRYAQRIIIMDMTGFGNRQNLALQYIKHQSHTTPIVVDSSVAHESIHQRGETIRRLSKQITAPFFMAIPAGSLPNNFDSFARMIQHIPSRVIHWSFPFTIGATAIVPNQLQYGLFITKPYKELMKSPETESFTGRLRKEEKETEMGLSWFCTDVWFV
jgi:hypothetical protein